MFGKTYYLLPEWTELGDKIQQDLENDKLSA